MSDIAGHKGLEATRVAVLSVVGIAAGVGWFLSHLLPSARWAIHHQIFADNRTTTTICLAVAAFYITHLNGPVVQHRRRQIGLIVLAISLAAHREVWAWWRWYLGRGDLVMADWIRDDIAWITSIAQLGVWLGLGIILSAFVFRYFDSRADWIVAAGIIGCWSMWFLISAGTA